MNKVLFSNDHYTAHTKKMQFRQLNMTDYSFLQSMLVSQLLLSNHFMIRETYKMCGAGDPQEQD